MHQKMPPAAGVSTDYCHGCGEFAALEDGVYCSQCLEKFRQARDPRIAGLNRQYNGRFSGWQPQRTRWFDGPTHMRSPPPLFTFPGEETGG